MEKHVETGAARAAGTRTLPPGARDSLRHAVHPRGEGLRRAGLDLLLVAMIVVPTLLCLLFTLNILSASYTGYDFSVYYAAALALRDNLHANIFDLHLLRAVAAAHGATLPTVIYTYPPLLAVLLLPLTILPYRVALDVWTLLNVGVWIACAALFTVWFRRVCAYGVLAAPDSSVPARDGARGFAFPATARPPRLFVLAIGVFLTLSYQPVEQTLVLGQVSLVVLLLLVLAPVLVERKRPYLAGFVLALAVWIKLFPALLIVYYLLRGQRRVALGATIAVVLLALVQLPILGLDGVLATRHVLDNGAFQAAQFQNEALARVPLWIAAEFGGHLSSGLALAGYALVALVGAAFVEVLLRLRGWKLPVAPERISEPAAANRELLGYAWALCTMVLVAPISWEHYDSWLLPACVVCLGVSIRASATGFRDARGHIRREVYALAAILVAYVLTMHHLPLGYDGTTTFAIGPYIGGHPLRPFFMLLRPLAALLAWVSSGALFLGACHPRGASSLVTSTTSTTPPLSLSRRLQATVVCGLLLAVIAAQAVLLTITMAFGAYQAK
ncbi:MAG: glycosyltransferase family 87 protein [Acetobacteraceae bacterium]